MSSDFDVLIIGSGAAGLTAALNLAATRTVAVLAKGELGGGATEWAQGGIAAVLEQSDSFDAHVRDTMIAGAGLNNLSVVEHVVGEAPAAIARLAELGVPFNLDDAGEGWHLTREGGHSHRRIVHVADATGWAIQEALEKAALANPNITIIPDMVAIDLATGRHATEFTTSGAVHGVYAYNRTSGAVETLVARATVLTDDDVRFLRDEDFHVAVSIDGPRTLNDAQRPLHNGGSSYDKVLLAMERFERLGHPRQRPDGSDPLRLRDRLQLSWRSHQHALETHRDRRRDLDFTAEADGQQQPRPAFRHERLVATL